MEFFRGTSLKWSIIKMCPLKGLPTYPDSSQSFTGNTPLLVSMPSCLSWLRRGAGCIEGYDGF